MVTEYLSPLWQRIKNLFSFLERRSAYEKSMQHDELEDHYKELTRHLMRAKQVEKNHSKNNVEM